ncbi:MAG: riboflavin synthase [Phycisphaerales bacterium]
MFTGLVEQTGFVAALERVDFGARLWIDPRGWSHSPSPGDSIAVDGCCLTVAALESPGWRFDVVRQTLEVTTLGSFAAGRRVNLERSATPSTLLGGHIVQGHVDGNGTLESVTRDATQWRVRVVPPPTFMRLVVDRGSIAVDGVSLTVAGIGPHGEAVAAATPSSAALSIQSTPSTSSDRRDRSTHATRSTSATPSVRPTWFDVALIPTTLARTTLGERTAGDRVNLESDCVVRAVAALMEWDRAGMG